MYIYRHNKVKKVLLVYAAHEMNNSNKLDQSEDQRNYKQIIVSIAVL